jgi:hypothetical protein
MSDEDHIWSALLITDRQHGMPNRYSTPRVGSTSVVDRRPGVLHGGGYRAIPTSNTGSGVVLG